MVIVTGVPPPNPEKWFCFIFFPSRGDKKTVRKKTFEKIYNTIIITSQVRGLYLHVRARRTARDTTNDGNNNTLS